MSLGGGLPRDVAVEGIYQVRISLPGSCAGDFPRNTRIVPLSYFEMRFLQGLAVILSSLAGRCYTGGGKQSIGNKS
jgi:hypothetical protein